MTLQEKQDQLRAAALEAEKAINEEVRKFELDFAELSITIRELLGKVYIRGGMDTLNKVKNANVQQDNKDFKI